MVPLLMMFGTIWGKSWSGENARLMQGVSTGPGHVEWAGGAFLPGPGSITPEIHPVRLVRLVETPARPRGGHHEATRVGPDQALDRPALVLAQAVEGMAVAHGDCDGPAVARLPPDVLQAARERRGEAGVDWGRRCALAWLLGPGGGATDHDDADQPPRQDGRPQADPGLDLRLGCRGRRRPAVAPAGQRVGGAQPLALPRRPPAALARRGLGPGLELAGEQEPRDHVARVREVAQAFLGGIAAVRARPHRPAGPLSGPKVHAGARQRTPGAIRLGVLRGLLCFAVEFQAHRDGHAVPGPPPEWHAPDAEPTVHAPSGPLFLAGRAGPVAIAGHPCDGTAGLCLGGVVTRDDDGGLGRNQRRGVTTDPGPHPPARIVEGASQADREPGARLHGGRPRPPQRGGDRVRSRSQGPTAGHAGEALPRPSGQASRAPRLHEQPQ
jgi:hypothetical protein